MLLAQYQENTSKLMHAIAIIDQT